jgi:NTE family protein
MTQPNAKLEGGRVAIVLSGAGARGAYEAGALSVLLPRLTGDDRPRMVLGTSSGALNAAMLSSFLNDDADAAGRALIRSWEQITPDKVFETPRRSLVRLATRYLRRPADTAPGLLDTTPLRKTLDELLPARSFATEATKRETLDAVAIIASSCDSGGTTVFLESASGMVPKSGAGIKYVETQLGPDHLMASSAFPVGFPPQWVTGPAEGWYIDGGVHLNTPFTPAIDLGADRILVIGGTPSEISQSAERFRPPNLMDVQGQILHALLTDSLRADLDSLVQRNIHLRAEGSASDQTYTAAGESGSRIQCCTLSPKGDLLDDVAVKCWPPGLLRLLRSLGNYPALGPILSQRQRPGQFLSYLCFSTEFISAAIAAGRSDAEELIKSTGRIPWISL